MAEQNVIIRGKRPASSGAPKTPAQRSAIEYLESAPPESPIPTIPEITAGLVPPSMLGGRPLPQSIIDRANQGDDDALDYINQSILAEQSIRRRDSEDLKVFGTRRDPISGQMAVDIPAEITDPKQREELAFYADQGIRLNETLMTAVPDKNARALMLEEFTTGYMPVEFARQASETAGFFAKGTPWLALYMEDLATNFALEGGDSEKFAAQRKVSQERMAFALKQAKDVGFHTSFADKLNDDLKAKYIERHGEEEYKKRYILDTPEGEVEMPIIATDLGEDLLDFAYNELPFTDQFLIQFGGGIVSGGAMLAANMRRGSRLAKDVKDFKAINPAFKDVDDVVVLRHMRITRAERGAFSGIRSKIQDVRARIGNRFGYRGALGNYEESTQYSKSVKRLKDEIDDTRRELNLHMQKPSPDDAVIRQLNGRLESLSGRRNRLQFRNLGNPLITRVGVEEGLVAFGQTAGYNYLSEMFGIDQESGGFFGALTFALGGTKTVSAPLKITGLTANVFTAGLAGRAGRKMAPISSDLVRSIEDAAGLIPFIDKNRFVGIFTNRNFAEIEGSLRRPLTADETASLMSVAEVMDGIPDSQRGNIYDHLVNFNGIRNRLLGVFEPGSKQYNQAADILTQSFGIASGLSAFQAIEADRLKSFSLKNFNEAVEAQGEMEAGIRQADFLMQQFDNLLANAGVDPKDAEYAKQWMDGFRSAADNLARSNSQIQQEYLGILDQYKQELIMNPLTTVDDPNIVERLSRLETILTPGALDDIGLQRQILTETTKDFGIVANERLKTLESMRGTPFHTRQLGLEVENAYVIHQGGKRAKIKAAYLPVDKAFNQAGNYVDLGGLAKNLMSRMRTESDKSLRGIFSADREMLSGPSGYQARKAFDAAAERALREGYENADGGLGLDDNELELLVKYFRNQGADSASYIGENPTFIDIAIHLSEAEGSTFKPFLASGSEADTIYQHFRNKAVRLETSNPKLAAAFAETASAVDADLKSTVVDIDGVATDIGPMIQAARDETRGLIYDTTRAGTVTGKIDSASVGPDLVTPTPDGYNRRYKKGMSPEQWYEQDAKAMGAAIDGGNFKSKEFIDELYFTWGDYDFKSNSRYFDVSTEEGVAKLETVEKIIKANLYENWYKDRFDVVSGIQGKAAEGVGVSGYNVKRVDNVERLRDNLKVRVKNADGEFVDYNLDIGLDDMLVEETNIVQLAASSRQVSDQAKRFISEINRTIGDASSEINVEMGIQKRAVNDMLRVAELNDPEQFFTKYIMGGSPRTLEEMRDRFVANRGDISPEMATEEFNKGATYLIVNGMMKYAGVVPVKGDSYMALDGSRRTIETMMNPEKVMAAMDNPNVVEMMEIVGISFDNQRYLYDMAEYLTTSSGVSGSLKLSLTKQGQIRGISPNEVISRAFNIARGMVSPTYVAAEIGFRLMQQNNLSVFELAAGDKVAGEIIHKMILNPEDLTDPEMSTLIPRLMSFISREVVRQGKDGLSEEIADIETLMAIAEQEAEARNKELQQ